MIRRALTLAGIAALFAASTAAAKPPQPTFVDFSKREQKRVLERVSEAPAPYKRLLRATYDRIKVRALFENNASYISVKDRSGEKRYVVYFDIETRARGATATT